jgi:GDP-L-fucose synthase
MKKILILGGFGFMGRNLNKEFENSEYKIINASRRNDVDLMNYDSIKNCLMRTKPDIIINSAAHVGSIKYVMEKAGDVVYDNTMMYLNLFKAVAEVNPKIRIINPISNCSYPGIIDVQDESEWWNGEIHHSVMSYGNPKKLGYIASRCFESQYGVKTTNLIMANSYGPNDYIDEEKSHAFNGIIKRMIKAQRNGDKTFKIWGTGKVIREWIYMPDMARFIKMIIDEEKFDLPNPINVGIGEGISILESAEMARKALNYDCEFEFDTSKQDGAPVKVLGVKHFRELFPDFKFTGYNKGIEETIKYYKEILL